MENLTLWEIIVVCVVGFLGLATFINTVGSAAEKIAKVRKTLKTPNDEQDKRLSVIEKDVENIRAFLESDKTRLTALEKGNGVWMRGMLALLGHGLDGNNQKEMEAARKELEEYLIHR